jgi:hypothetical protein
MIKAEKIDVVLSIDGGGNFARFGSGFSFGFFDSSQARP